MGSGQVELDRDDDTTQPDGGAMSDRTNPGQEPQTVLQHIEETFRAAGFDVGDRKSPAGIVSAVEATVPISRGRARQAVVTHDPASNHIVLTWTNPSRTDEEADATSVGTITNSYTCVVGIGPSIVDFLRTSVLLESTSDPLADSAELRHALEFIGDLRRNSTIAYMGNPRSPDLYGLANIALRLLDRIERLEGRLD
jgi:hypothetical protein